MTSAAVDDLPASIRVGPYDVAIEVWREPDPAAFGRFDPEAMTIYLRGEWSSEAHAVDIFLHEVLHAVAYVYSLCEGRITEERVAATLGTALMAVFRDNSWLPAWLGRALS